MRIATLCFVISDNRILLLERKNTWFENGMYLPPGGNVDKDEDPKKSSARELLEETGLTVNPDKLKLVRSYQNYANDEDWDNFYYLATDYTGKLENKEASRHSDIDWFTLDHLPNNTSKIVYDTLKLI